MPLIPVFDGHNDVLYSLYLHERGHGRSFFEKSKIGHIDLPRAREGGFAGGLFALYVPAPLGSPERQPHYGLTVTKTGYDVKLASPLEYPYAKEYTQAVLGLLFQIIEQSEGAAKLVSKYDDLENNLRAGVISVVMHMEGAEAISEDLSDLEDYYAAGLRSLGPVWSRSNRFGHGVPFRYPHSPDTGPGLTEAGKRLVRECNRLGIMVDLAHITERGFWDVAELTDAPLVVSHAGVHALCRSTRNITDRQIDALGETGGLLGVIFEPSNLTVGSGRETDIPLTEIVRHIDYVVNRIGIDHVALGSDFDGASMPDELRDVAGLPKLIDALAAAGYNREAIEKIAYKNWFRVLRDTWRDKG